MTQQEKTNRPKRRNGKKKEQNGTAWYFDNSYYTPLWLEALEENCSPERKEEIKTEILVASREIASGVVKRWRFTDFELEDDLVNEAVIKVITDFEKFGTKVLKANQKLSAHTYLTTIIKNHLLTHIAKIKRQRARATSILIIAPDGSYLDSSEVYPPQEDKNLSSMLDDTPISPMMDLLSDDPIGRSVLEFLGLIPGMVVSYEQNTKVTFKALFIFLRGEGHETKKCKAYLRKMRRIYEETQEVSNDTEEENNS